MLWRTVYELRLSGSTESWSFYFKYFRVQITPLALQFYPVENKGKFNVWIFSPKCVFFLLFICEVVPDSLQTQWPQHARHPCPSVSPKVCSNSCPLSQWCYLIISSSAAPFVYDLSQHQGLCQWGGYSHQVAKVLVFQLQHQPFQTILRLVSFRNDWFELLGAKGVLKSFLQHHNLKASIFWCSACFMG